MRKTSGSAIDVEVGKSDTEHLSAEQHDLIFGVVDTGSSNIGIETPVNSTFPVKDRHEPIHQAVTEGRLYVPSGAPS